MFTYYGMIVLGFTPNRQYSSHVAAAYFNNRPMDHSAYLWKQLQSYNTHDYNNVDLEKKTPLFTLWELNGPSFEQTWIPSSKNALCQVWLKLAWQFWRRFLNFVNVFRYFVIISPWKRAGHFIWTNLNFYYTRMLYAKFGWN